MKNMKKIVAITSLVGILGLTSFAYAYTYSSNSATCTNSATCSESSSCTDESQCNKIDKEPCSENQNCPKTVIIDDKITNTEEFKSQTLEGKKAILDINVKSGALTKEKADEIYNSIITSSSDSLNSKSCGSGLQKGSGCGSCKSSK